MRLGEQRLIRHAVCARSEMKSLMTLVTSSEILSKAYKEAYMVPGCDGWNLESIQAIVDGAQDARSPIILQVWAGELDYPGLDYWAAIAERRFEAFRIQTKQGWAAGDIPVFAS